MVVAGENNFERAGLVSLGDPFGVSERGQPCRVGSTFTTSTIVMRGPLQGDPGMAALHPSQRKVLSPYSSKTQAGSSLTMSVERARQVHGWGHEQDFPPV